MVNAYKKNRFANHEGGHSKDAKTMGEGHNQHDADCCVGTRGVWIWLRHKEQHRF
ncbi:hypothetical protein D3C74_469640 [compost metagenome]